MKKQRIICLVKICNQKLGPNHTSAHINQLYFSATVRWTLASDLYLFSTYCVKSTGGGTREKRTQLIYDIKGVINTHL